MMHFTAMEKASVFTYDAGLGIQIWELILAENLGT